MSPKLKIDVDGNDVTITGPTEVMRRVLDLPTLNVADSKGGFAHGSDRLAIITE